MADVSVVKFEDLEDDLKEFMLRAQNRTHRQSMRKIQEYVSPFVSERSIFNRVPLDGGAVLSIYEAKDKTFDLIKRLMNLDLTPEVLVILKESLKNCNHLEIRLQSLIYHIQKCPQYDLEIVDINEKLSKMEKMVENLEKDYKTNTNDTDNVLEKYGLLQLTESDEDDQKSYKQSEN